jgi:glycine hydroxymethyltransferase
MESTDKSLFFDEGLVKDTDEELYQILKDEETRQREGINLIASENYASEGVLEILGTPLQNKYAEGYPGARYYRGTEFCDKVELLAQKRALEAFELDDDKWGVNVQPHSGCPANFEVYTALVGKDGKIMGLNLQDGGHLSHGFERVSATSVYFHSKPYHVDVSTGFINYDKLEEDAMEFKPKLIIAGYSAYPRDLDYERFRKICDKCEAYLMVDMAHYNGLVVGKVVKNPFEYADVVTTTTHKIMRGPRGGMIFYKKELDKQINFSVFPQHQGGPHMNQIAALAYALKDLSSDRYKEYAVQIVKNTKALAEGMIAKGWELATGGTENHIILWNVKGLNLTGGKVEACLEKMLIYSNKNSVAGDKSPMNPSGVRFGLPAMTTRGMIEEDMTTLVKYFEKAIELGLKVQKKSGKKIKDFLDALDSEDFKEDIAKLQDEVKEFTKQFPVPKTAIR